MHTITSEEKKSLAIAIQLLDKLGLKSRINSSKYISANNTLIEIHNNCVIIDGDRPGDLWWRNDN
jgi:hypothetical protein